MAKFDSAEEQADLFAHTHARTEDPDTSHIAAKSMKEAALKQALSIHAVLCANGPGHIESIANYIEDMDKVQVSRRMIDLEKLHLAKRTGRKGKLSTGRPAQIWMAVDPPSAQEGE